MAVEVYAFISTKGGTGKTTLAVAAALGLAARGRKLAVYDLDLVGSSIGDGLPLCAPDVALVGGALDLARPAPALLDRARTLAARGRRAAGRVAFVHLPYLNDALLHTSERGPGPLASAYVWRRGPDDPVAWFPSSPCLHDVAVCSAWTGRRDLDRLGERLQELMEEATETLGLDTVLLDLPPGIAGFAELFLRRFRVPRGPFAGIVPVFVTTPDRHDLYTATDFFSKAVLSYPSMRFVLNRSRQPLDELRAEVRRTLGSLLGPSRAEDRLRAVAFHPDTLGQAFTQDRLELRAELLDEALRAMELR